MGNCGECVYWRERKINSICLRWPAYTYHEKGDECGEFRHSLEPSLIAIHDRQLVELRQEIAQLKTALEQKTREPERLGIEPAKTKKFGRRSS